MVNPGILYPGIFQESKSRDFLVPGFFDPGISRDIPGPGYPVDIPTPEPISKNWAQDLVNCFLAKQNLYFQTLKNSFISFKNP